MSKILSIINKEIKLLFRDPAGFIMLFVLPACFIFVLSIALQGVFSSPNQKEKMKILVVNNDKGDLGSEIIAGLEKSGYFKADTLINNQKVDLDKAKKYLQKGDYKIVLNFPENTTSAVNFEQDATIDILVDPVLTNEFAGHITNTIQNFINFQIIKNIAGISKNILTKIKETKIEELDKQIKITKNKKAELLEQLEEFKNSNMEDQVRDVVIKMTNDNIEELNQKIKEFTKQKNQTFDNKNDAEANQFSSVRDRVGLKVNQFYYAAASGTEIFPNSVQQNVPGWTIFALFWIVQIITLNVIGERQIGVFKRIKIAPVNSLQYIIGKIIPFFIINLIQAVFMFAIGVYILPLFGCPALVIKNITGLILVTVSISMVAISLGLLLATIIRSVLLAASLSATIILLLTIFGGIMVPKFIMPEFMQKMSLFIPHGWALDGYLNILVRDYSTLQILPTVGVLCGFAFIFFTISLIFFNKLVKDES